MPQEWYYAQGGVQKGPVTDAQLKALIAVRQLQANDLVWREGMAEWTRAGTVKGLWPEPQEAKQPTQPTQPPERTPSGGASVGRPSVEDWYYAKAGTQFGPIGFSQLSELATTGQIQPTDLVWRDGMPNWAKANTVEGLFSKAHPSGSPATPISTPPLPPVVPRPAHSATGNLVIVRKPKLTGFMHAVRVIVDGTERGTLGGGLADGLWDVLGSRRKSLTIALPPGEHTVELKGGGLSRSATVRLEAGCTSQFIAFFSNLGALGGGLNLVEAKAGENVPNLPSQQVPSLGSPPSQGIPSSGPSKVSMRGVVVLALVCLGLLLPIFGAIRGCAQSGRGAITFAEQIDPKTFKTTNEGTQFTTGWVWMLVRGKTAFGDTRLILYGRVHGTETWSVLGEQTVDPKWDVVAWRERLDAPGRFDIRVATSKGTSVAEGTVSIENK